ncbi:tm1809 family CRISPR-associated protein [Peptoniphilus indolicus ATCC 29427]|uniref:Tm1809 family CRISPR-associated protein n=2 Tax=Peptoniphilus indolicus TaxID=33030 RepID=G4D321_9FIRM|nr:tm1809 family CRISPR-associated protein [Peptoniphilus indolicus ATCC 29427]
MEEIMFEIKIKLTTKSNCLIGNQTESFSVGGVDQSTSIDNAGKPIIHGSSFKGALRNIIRENDSEMPKTKEYIKEILKELIDKYNQIDFEGKIEKLEKIKMQIEEYASNPKAEYIFGIQGLNGIPRIFCTDFVLSKDKQIEDYFSIDTKTSLEEKEGEILSRPRTYRVIRPGVDFEGIVHFKNSYYNPKNIDLEEVKEELESMIEKFNNGFYGIGNSKSRGYGHIEISILH